MVPPHVEAHASASASNASASKAGGGGGGGGGGSSGGSGPLMVQMPHGVAPGETVVFNVQGPLTF
jgi:hypothetical protein